MFIKLEVDFKLNCTAIVHGVLDLESRAVHFLFLINLMVREVAVCGGGLSGLDSWTNGVPSMMETMEIFLGSNH